MRLIITTSCNARLTSEYFQFTQIHISQNIEVLKIFWFYFRYNTIEEEKIVTSRCKHYASCR